MLVLAALTSLLLPVCTQIGQAQVQLQRNEVIALMNLLAKLADSVEVVRSLSLVLDQEEAQKQ